MSYLSIMKSYRLLNLLLTLLAVAFVQQAVAQRVPTPQDSLLIATTHWNTTTTTDGITLHQAQIKGLYSGVQSVEWAVIPAKSIKKSKFGIAGNGGMRPTSVQAAQHRAVVAINGTYYDMRKGNSVCFYKEGRHTIDSTSVSEFQGRVNGAIRVYNNKLDILEWSPSTERNYRGKRGTVLASGPLLLQKGVVADWSSFGQSFINDRHPRSAVFTTRKGDVVMLTVDGRSKGNADGVSIPELAFLARMLGAEDAINLDGGGSTTLWLKELGVVNYPSDNRRYDHAGERAVSNIVYFSIEK
jgi:exopolysaccharide biosynthesis protein